MFLEVHTLMQFKYVWHQELSQSVLGGMGAIRDGKLGDSSQLSH